MSDCQSSALRCARVCPAANACHLTHMFRLAADACLCALCCTRVRQAAHACQLTHIVAHVIVWRPMPAILRTLFVWQRILVCVSGAGNSGYGGKHGNVLQIVQSWKSLQCVEGPTSMAGALWEWPRAHAHDDSSIRWPLRLSDAGVRASKQTLCAPCAL